MLVMAAGLVVL